jgi:formylmethanofuran dehydrogenase subunit A
MRLSAFAGFSLAVALAACAKPADQISAAYISPLQYENYNCTQISQEAQRLSSRAAQVAGSQDQAATRDAVAMGVGAIIFWPTLLMIGGDGPQAYELARLKGEMEAIEQVAIKKNCGIQFQRPQPKPVVAAGPQQNY